MEDVKQMSLFGLSPAPNLVKASVNTWYLAFGDISAYDVSRDLMNSLSDAALGRHDNDINHISLKRYSRLQSRPTGVVDI